MKVLEIFCGTKSFSRCALARGHDVFTVDYNSKFNPDMVLDMIYFQKKNLPVQWRNPDVLWCSPPCETFSLSGNSMYLGFPTGSKAYIGLALAYKCIELVWDLKPCYWIIENPRGGLRSVWFMRCLGRTTVTYCQYGETKMKPTDLFNNFGYIGKCCKNGDGCHERAPRGSKSGTQGEKSRELRGIVPRRLCDDILDFIEKDEINK